MSGLPVLNWCSVLLMLHRLATVQDVYPVIWSILMNPALMGLWLGGTVKPSYILATWKRDSMGFSGHIRRTDKKIGFTKFHENLAWEILKLDFHDWLDPKKAYFHFGPSCTVRQTIHCRSNIIEWFIWKVMLNLILSSVHNSMVSSQFSSWHWHYQWLIYRPTV